jgi:hypothetical protein
VQLVGKISGEELSVHRLAALDHQPLHAAAAEILADPVHAHRLAAVDDGRHGAESLRRLVNPCAGAVDHLLGVAGREERGQGVQPSPSGDGDLDR